MVFQRGDELGPFGVDDRDVVLDAHRVDHLAAEALGDETGPDALAGRVDGCCSAGRPAADDQHVERCLRGDLLGLARARTAVEFRQDLLDGGAALEEHLAVQIGRRHRHDASLLDLLLEQCAVDRDHPDPRIDHRHRIQRLHDVRAVLAGQRHVGLEAIVAGQRADPLDEIGVELRRMATDLQQRKHQRRELVTERDRREADIDSGAGAADHERGSAHAGIGLLDQRDHGRYAGDVVEQRLHFP